MSDAHPRLLFLAFYFPPTRASGVFRSLAVANHFADAGWDVTVMTPQREFFTDMIRSVDETLEATIHDDVTIERVHFPGRPWQKDLRQYSWFRGNFKPLHDRLWSLVETGIFPEMYSPWIPRVVRRAWQLHREERFDVVMATGNPYSSFAAAWALKRLLKIPYVIDYRDSWTLDQFNECAKFEDDSPVWRWEQRIVDAADRIVFVNDAQREWHAERYPAVKDRMLVVENGYDPSILGNTDDNPAPEPDRGLRLGYIGTITHQLPLQEFLAGWRLARQEPGLEDAEVVLYGHLGFFPNQAPRMMNELRVLEDIGVSYGGSVPKADIARVYDDLDVLLMIIPSSKYVTAGKVYEYMATGKPVVAVHEPWTGARIPLEGYPLAAIVDDLEPRTVADAILEAAHMAHVLDPAEVAAAKEHARRYTRAAQLAPLEQELQRLARG